MPSGEVNSPSVQWTSPLRGLEEHLEAVVGELEAGRKLVIEGPLSPLVVADVRKVYGLAVRRQKGPSPSLFLHLGILHIGSAVLMHP